MDGIRIEVRQLIQTYLVNSAQGRDLLFESLEKVWPEVPELLADAKKTLDLDTKLLKYVSIGVLVLYGILYIAWEIVTKLKGGM